MRVLVAFSGAIILSSVVTAQVAHSAAGEGAWSQKTGMGEPRTEAAVVYVNGKLLMIGGMARGMDSATLVQEYDPKTDKWRERAPLPSPLSHPGAALLNGKVYVVGGFLRNVHLYAQIYSYEYDPAKNSWRALPWMKAARGSVGVVALNGKIHAIGGRGIDRVVVNTHEVYDPATNRWTLAPPLPQARDHFAIAVADGRVHVIGGRFDTPVENTDKHDVFDPATNAWTSAPAMLEPRSGSAAVLYHDQILVMGGECNNGKPFTQNAAYNPKTMTWTAMAPMPTGRHGISITTDGVAVYVPGGAPMCATASSDTLMLFSLPVAATH